MNTGDLKKEVNDKEKENEKKPEQQEKKLDHEAEPNLQDDLDLLAENEELRKKNDKSLPPPKKKMPSSMGTNAGFEFYPGAVKMKKSKLPTASKNTQGAPKGEKAKKPVKKANEKSKADADDSKVKCDKKVMNEEKEPIKKPKETEQATSAVQRTSTGSESRIEANGRRGCLSVMWAKARAFIGC